MHLNFAHAAQAGPARHPKPNMKVFDLLDVIWNGSSQLRHMK